MSLAITQPITGELVTTERINHHKQFIAYFDFKGAAQEVIDHCMSLSSSKRYLKRGDQPPTLRKYSYALTHFQRFLLDADNEFREPRLPTGEVVREFLATWNHLTAKTIGAYLPAIRRFIRNLASMHTPMSQIPSHLIYDMLDYQTAIRTAADIPTPQSDETNYDAPITHPDHRKAESGPNFLTQEQAIDLLRSIPRDTLPGLRDYTLLHIGFNTGLRIAEIAQITLNSFQMVDAETYKLATIGKRNNTTPVPCPKAVYDQVCKWVNTYNAQLPEGDPRRIGRDDRIWRSLTKAGNIFTNLKTACAATTHKGLYLRVIECSEAWDFRIAPHDMRRTAACVAYARGMPLREIQMMLRHKSIQTTERYLRGLLRDYSKSNIATYGGLITAE